MSVNDNKETTNETKQTRFGFQTQEENTQSQAESHQPRSAYSYQPQPQPEEVKRFDWINANIGSYYPFVNTSFTSADLNEIKKGLEEALANRGKIRGIDISIHAIDKSNFSNLAASYIVVACRYQDKDVATTPQDLVALHCLVLESSIENLSMNQHDLPILAYEVADYQSVITIANEVAAITGVSPEKHICTAVEVLPKKTDTSNGETLERILINSILACQEELVRRTIDDMYLELNLADADYRSSYLNQVVKFQRGANDIDVYGRPIRADITLDMVARSTVDLGNGVVQEKNVTHCTGFIELYYNDAASNFIDESYLYNNQLQFAAMGDYSKKPVYQAALILTSVANNRVQTPAGTLLAIINATGIIESNQWVNGLLPDHSKRTPEMNDIGNIGYDIPLTLYDPNNNQQDKYKKLETTPTSGFSPSALQAIVNHYFHAGVALAIDVPLGMPDSWKTAFLLDAAMGNNEALAEIYNAAMTLTNGLFSEEYQRLGGTGRFVSSSSTIDLGYFVKDGEVKDIRYVDYLAVAGQAGGARDRDLVMTYTDTMNNVNHLSDMERLRLRKNIIQTCLGEVTYTSRAVRVFLESTFVEALKRAAAKCGYVVSSYIPANSRDTGRQNLDLAAYALGSDASGVFKTTTLGANSMGFTRNHSGQVSMGQSFYNY